MAGLSIRGLRKSYEGKQVLHGVDLQMRDGDFVVIVGPSGCGKSTLLRMIAGLETITEGEIAIGGTRVNDLAPADRGCAMVFQNYALYPHMTVAENIGYPLKIAGLSKAARIEKIREAASVLDLSALLDRRPAQLSGGQRQRVAMGRAIVRAPKVFLFDEPLSNLDAKLRVTMRIEIKRLHRRLNATSIFVTHDQVEAMTLADQLIVMNGGHVEQVGTPLEIYRKPASAFVAGFLGAPAMNLMEAEVVKGRIRLVAGGTWLPIAATHLPDGSRFLLGIRPEETGVEASGGITARLEMIEELGGSRVAWCNMGGQELAVVLPRDFADKTPGTLQIDLHPGALHAFAIETGTRLNVQFQSIALREVPA